MAAQAAVSFVKRGCEMLNAGKAAIDEFKGEAEGVIGDAKAVVVELKGLYEWAKGLWDSVAGLFGKEKAADVVVDVAPVPVKKAKKRVADPEPEVLQLQMVSSISQKLGEFFEIQKKLKDYYRDLEEESLHVYDPNQNSAIKAKDRVFVELQLEEMTVQIREAMVYAPKELKDFYSRFLAMYGKINEEQEFARQEQLRAARNERWLQERLRNNRVDRWLAIIGVLLATLWVWMILLGTALQSRMQIDFWSD